MINKDYLAKQLRSLENRVVADKNWKREQRKLLVSQLKSQTEDIVGLETEKELHIFSHFRMILKPVVLLLVFVFGSGWLGVMASVQSLPGDLLYPIKISSEKAKVSLTFDKNKKAELHIESAQKRVDEIKELKKQVVEEQKVLEKDIIKDTYVKVAESVNEAKETLQELKDETAAESEDQEKAADLVKTVGIVDDTVKNMTKDLGEILEDQAVLIEGEVIEESIVEEGVSLEDALTGLDSLGEDIDVIVKETVENIEEIDDEEASDAVSKMIESSATELEEKTDKIIEDLNTEEESVETQDFVSPEVIKEIVEELPEELLPTASEAGLLTGEESSEEIVEEVIEEEVSLIDEEVLLKIEALLDEENMEFSLEEGKELSDILNEELILLLNNGELDKALEHLETSKIIVEKMEVAVQEIQAADVIEDPSAEEGRDGLAEEIIIEEEESVETEDFVSPGIAVEEPVLEEEIPSETN